MWRGTIICIICNIYEQIVFWVQPPILLYIASLVPNFSLYHYLKMYLSSQIKHVIELKNYLNKHDNETFFKIPLHPQIIHIESKVR